MSRLANFLMLMAWLWGLSFAMADELTVAQQKTLKSAGYYIQKAEQASSMANMQMYMRYGTRYLSQLEKEVPDYPKVKELQQRCQRLLVRGEIAKAAQKVKSTLRHLAYRLKRYSDPARMPAWEKKNLNRSLEDLQKGLAIVKAGKDPRYDKMCQEAEKLVIAAGAAVSPDQKPNPQQTTATPPTPKPETTTTAPPAASELTSTQKYQLRQAKYYLDRAERSPAQSRQRDLQRCDGYLKMLTAQTPEHPDVQKIVARYRGLQSASATNNTPTKPIAKSPQLDAQEKKAVARMRSILSFAKRSMNSAQQILAYIKAGSSVSSRSMAPIIHKLRQYVQDAQPHVAVLDKNRQKHKAQLDQYQEITATLEQLQKIGGAAQSQEQEKAVSGALNYFEHYLRKAETELAGYQQTLAGRDPANELRSLCQRIEFNLGKAQKELDNAQGRYRSHPKVEDAARRLDVMQKSYQSSRSSMQQTVVMQTANHMLEEARKQVAAGKSYNDIHENQSLQQAAKTYAGLVSYLQEHHKLAKAQKILAQAKQEQADCAGLQVESCSKGALRAIDKGYLAWMATNVKWARSFAGNNQELQNKVRDKEATILAAACKKAFANREHLDNNLNGWQGKYWKHITAVATTDAGKSIVAAHCEQPVRQYLEQAEKTMASQDLDPRQQQKKVQGYLAIARTLADISPQLQKKVAGSQAKIDKLYNALQQRIAQKVAQEKEQADLARKKFENSLSAAQSAVYQEWDKKYPDKREESPQYTSWVYIKNDGQYAEVHHHYRFDAQGKLLQKEKKRSGGGRLNDYVYNKFLKSWEWGEAASVNKNGKVYGYRNASWTNILEFHSNGKVYGYRDDSWTNIGEIRKDGKVYGYHQGSWTNIGDIRPDGKIYGYNNGSWSCIAELRADGKVVGYNRKGDWTTIDIRIASHEYLLATIFFVINRQALDIYK